MAAGEAGFDAGCDVVVANPDVREGGCGSGRGSDLRWVVLASGIVRILPVAILRLVDREPVFDEVVVALDYVGGVVEEIIDDLAV